MTNEPMSLETFNSMFPETQLPSEPFSFSNENSEITSTEKKQPKKKSPLILINEKGNHPVFVFAYRNYAYGILGQTLMEYVYKKCSHPALKKAIRVLAEFYIGYHHHFCIDLSTSKKTKTSKIWFSEYSRIEYLQNIKKPSIVQATTLGCTANTKPYPIYQCPRLVRINQYKNATWINPDIKPQFKKHSLVVSPVDMLTTLKTAYAFYTQFADVFVSNEPTVPKSFLALYRQCVNEFYNINSYSSYNSRFIGEFPWFQRNMTDANIQITFSFFLEYLVPEQLQELGCSIEQPFLVPEAKYCQENFAKKIEMHVMPLPKPDLLTDDAQLHPSFAATKKLDKAYKDLNPLQSPDDYINDYGSNACPYDYETIEEEFIFQRYLEWNRHPYFQSILKKVNYNAN